MEIRKNQLLLTTFILGFLILLTSSVFSTAYAQSDVGLIQTGRYTTVVNQPKPEQLDLLAPIIQVHFLSEIKTVGDAINNLLRYSGYSLVDVKQQSIYLINTLNKPLPLVDRDLGPVSLRQSLQLLMGSAFEVVVDPLNRTINFQLKPEFEPNQ